MMMMWLIWASVDGSAVYTGGGGFAAYQQWTSPSVVGIQWVSPPEGDLTIEHWLCLTDPHLTETVLIGYSAYSVKGRFGVGGGTYEQANELVLSWSPNGMRLRHSEALFCGSEACVVPYANAYEWVHVALTWNVTSRVVEFYLNATVVARMQGGSEYGFPLQPGGILHLGQEADAPWSDFDELQSMDGLYDEFRVWSRIRSQEEIREGFERTPLDSDSSLVLYYDFDEVHVDDRGRRVVRDKSGNGNDALWGHLPTVADDLVFATDRGIVAPEEPFLYPSTAPVRGSGIVHAFLRRDGSAVFEVPAFAADGELSSFEFTVLPPGPSFGRVGRSTKKNRFTYYGSRQNDDDKFSVRVRNNAVANESTVATVRVWASEVPSPPDRKLEVVEDEGGYVALGVMSYAGSPVEVVIETLPHVGCLAQADFAAGSDPTYSSLDLTAARRRLRRPNTTLENARGIVVYFPEENDATPTTFTYRYRVGSASSSSSGVVSISVAAVNDAPVPRPANVTVRAGEGMAVIIDLLSDDRDSSFAQFSNSSISTFPRLGVLSQFSDEKQLVPTTAQPTLSSWATEIVRFSSQFSLCGRACYEWANPECPSNDAGKARTSGSGFVNQTELWGDGTCFEDSWHAVQLLGEADVYPNYKDHKHGFDLSTENFGREFVELRVSQPMFVTSVKVYEIFKPGAVAEIAVTDDYRDDNTLPCYRDDCPTNTTWTVLWRGDPAPQPDEARVFAPPLCFAPVESRVIRISFDTSAVPGWNNVDAVSFEGVGDLRRGTVIGGDKVVYTPLRGVHGEDYFEFKASDCLDESAPAIVRVTIDPPLVDLGEFTVLPYYDGTVYVSDDSTVTPYFPTNKTTKEIDVSEFSKYATIELRAASPSNLRVSFDDSRPWELGESVLLREVMNNNNFFKVHLSSPRDENFLPTKEDVLEAYENASPKFTLAIEYWVQDSKTTTTTTTTYRMVSISCYYGFVAFTSDAVPESRRNACLMCRAVEAAQWFDPSLLSADDIAILVASCSADSATTPYECSAGTFFNASSFACEPCAAGRFAASSGKTECAACPAGSYQQLANSNACGLCDATSFSEREGQSTCDSCPQNTRVRGGAVGSSNKADCLPLPGFYSRKWPVPTSGAKACPSGAVCEGGLAQPYPKNKRWMLLEYWNDDDWTRKNARVYECRFADLCTGGTRAVACSRDYAMLVPNATERSCLDVHGVEVELPEPSLREWCDAGGDVRSPFCENAIADGHNLYFALNTNYFRCPGRGSKRTRDIFTAVSWILVLSLFIAINEFVRPHYPVLDIVLDNYQMLGLLGNFWLAWPQDLSFLFTVYNIALFDVDVLTPTCSFQNWDYHHAFALMISMPLVYCGVRLAIARLAGPTSTTTTTGTWDAAIGSCLSFVMNSQPALLVYAVGAFTQRRVEGFDLVLAASPSTDARSTEVFYVRSVAVVVIVSVVVLLPAFIMLRLLALYRENMLVLDWVLLRYGFLFSDFRANALYWGAVRFSTTSFIAFVGALGWKYPYTQAVMAICCLLVSLSAQARRRPFLNDVLNRFEKAGLLNAIYTAALGMLFTSPSVGERRFYILSFYIIQILYVLVAIRETIRDVRVVSARDIARAKVSRVLAANKKGIFFFPHNHHFRRLSSSSDDLPPDLLQKRQQKKSLDAPSVDNMELFGTFRGDVLGSWVASAHFNEAPEERIDSLLRLEKLVGPFVSDESSTNNYSRSHQARFYRKVLESFPMLIDTLVDIPDDGWKTVQRMMDLLQTQHAEREHAPGGDVLAEAIEGIDRSSIAYFLLKCHKPEHRRLFKEVILDLVRAHPLLGEKRSLFLRHRAAWTIQRAWMARKMRRASVRRSYFRATSSFRTTPDGTRSLREDWTEEDEDEDSFDDEDEDSFDDESSPGGSEITNATTLVYISSHDFENHHSP